jgi:methyl-accepting chemotaxis protein
MRTLNGKVTLIALMAMVLVTGITAYSSRLGNKSLLQEVDRSAINNDQMMFDTVIDKHIQWLQYNLSQVFRLEDVVSAFRERDTEALEINATPAFELMRTQGNFSKLTFYVEPGVALFRAHQPEAPPDIVQTRRKMIIEALRTKEPVFGLEADQGSVNLFVIQPLYRDGEFLGVVEAGEDMAPILGEIEQVLEAQAVILLKPGIGSSRIMTADGSDLSALPADQQKILKRKSEALKRDDHVQTEERITNEAGSKTLATTLIPFKGFQGSDLGVMAITSDITRFTASVARSFSRSLTLAVAGFILASLLIFLTLRHNFRPLQTMAAILKDLAEGDGDLTRRIEVQSHEEIRELSTWMNSFIENIQKMVTQIKTIMNTVTSSAGEMIKNNERVSAGAGEQNNAIQEISKIMDIMDRNFREVVENTGNLAVNTEEASSSIMEMSASIEEVADNAQTSSQAVEETSSAIAQMVSSVNEIAGNIDAVSSGSHQTLASTEEIVRAIQEVDRNARVSLDITKEAVAKAQGGMASVSKTGDAMIKIKETFEASAQVIQGLGQKSAEIGKILKVIDEVSDQTNLLALNAAIIAAQAGEHGKGFAVVANEIKALAERSASSSREIADVIRSVQKEVNEAMQSMEVSSSRITEGMNLSVESGEVLQEIMESVQRSSQTMEEISNATLEQNKGSQVVRKTMDDITNSLSQIVNATQEQKQGSDQIVDNTERLRAMVLLASRAMQEQAKGGSQITKAIEAINLKSQDISKAAVGQSEQSHLVLSNIKKIEKIAGRNTSQVQEMSTSIANMTQMVEHLQAELDRFKV